MKLSKNKFEILKQLLNYFNLCGIFVLVIPTAIKWKNEKYHTVRTVLKIPHCQNSSNNTTLSEQF
jgi:hypothetical protein